MLSILFLANLLVTVPLLMATVHTMDADRAQTTDIRLFSDRSGTILRGEWLYRDTTYETLTPPLINLLLVPPNLAGDDVVHYGAYFGLFGFLVAITLYLGLRRYGATLAFGVALAYVASPWGYLTASRMTQDDTIIPLFVALAYLALLHGRRRSASALVGLGTMVKAFPAVAAPILFFSASTPRDRLRVAAYGFGAALAVALPFLLFVPGEFFAFLRFYATGEAPAGGAFHGHSLWKFLHDAGLGWSNRWNVLALLVVSAGLWWRTHQGRLDGSQAIPIAFLLFFLLYPKIHFGYYLCLLVLLLPWAYGSPGRMTGLVVAALMARVAHLAWHGVIPNDGAWLAIPILANLALGLLWLWWIRHIIHRGSWHAQVITKVAGGQSQRSGPTHKMHEILRLIGSRAPLLVPIALYVASLVYATGLALTIVT